eukprot:1326263-Amorphochlora_amoeboformis.AAC.3
MDNSPPPKANKDNRWDDNGNGGLSGASGAPTAKNDNFEGLLRDLQEVTFAFPTELASELTTPAPIQHVPTINQKKIF